MTERQTYSGSGEEKEFLALLEDKLRLTRKTNQIQVTNFLPPRLQSLAEMVLEKNSDLQWELEGGAPGAERQRIIVAPLHRELIPKTSRIVLLAMEGDFRHGVRQPATHRDYLGAILGTGIKREKLGDIWLTPAGCVAAVDQELAGYLSQQVIRVKGNSLEIRVLAPGSFNPPEKEVSQYFTTVASLRLDAVAAAGFRTARSRIAGEITAGRFSVNWQEVTRLDYLLKAGDVISARGRGRLVLQEASGSTAKGRIKISIGKYIL